MPRGTPAGLLVRVPLGIVAGAATYGLGRLVSPLHSTLAFVAHSPVLILISVAVCVFVVVGGIGLFFEFLSRT